MGLLFSRKSTRKHVRVQFCPSYYFSNFKNFNDLLHCFLDLAFNLQVGMKLEYIMSQRFDISKFCACTKIPENNSFSMIRNYITILYRIPAKLFFLWLTIFGFHRYARLCSSICVCITIYIILMFYDNFHVILLVTAQTCVQDI